MRGFGLSTQNDKFDALSKRRWRAKYLDLLQEIWKRANNYAPAILFIGIIAVLLMMAIREQLFSF